MRSEKEMIGMLLDFAREDKRVRAAVLGGSRADPNARRDLFRDYDIALVVTDVASFTVDHGWIDRFGPRRMLQMPEAMRRPMGDGRFNYQMLFMDGNRIDLTLYPALPPGLLKWESNSVVLLDKDGILAELPPASDRDYHILPPDRLNYDSCCNNFWWCTQNVAKGLWRAEFPYAFYMLDHILREELHDMMDWYIGFTHGFDRSVGKARKYYRDLLDDETYAHYLSTHCDAEENCMWEALFAMCGLFRKLGLEVGRHSSFRYPLEDDAHMTEYLEAVRRLPKEATELPL